MKQVKVLMLALIVLMGVGFTSCMNSDEDSIVERAFIVRSTNYGTAFKDASGLVLNPTSMTQILDGDIYYIYCRYDQSLITDASKSVNISLLSDPLCIDGEYVRNTPVLPDALIYSLESNSLSLFDSKTLIIPVSYWVKKESTDDAQDKELKKHHLILSYDSEAINENSTDLVLTLNHMVDDEEGEKVTRANYFSEYKAYNLSSALNAFESKTNKKPSKIIIKAKANSYENSFNNASDVQVDLTYPFKD